MTQVWCSSGHNSTVNCKLASGIFFLDAFSHQHGRDVTMNTLSSSRGVCRATTSACSVAPNQVGHNAADFERYKDTLRAAMQKPQVTDSFPVAVACDGLDVSTSGCYARLDRAPIRD